MLSMASPVEAAQPHQLSEAERNIVIKEQDTVLRTDEGPGDPDEEPTVNPVQELGQTSVEPGQQIVVLRQGLAEHKGHTQILHGNLVFRIAGLT